MYAQVKAGVDKLDKKGKQRILQALQKEVGKPAPQQAPVQQPAAEVPQQQAAPEQPPVQQQQPVAKPRARKPVNISGGKKAVQPQQQVASKEPKGNMVAESFSIFRKR